MEDLLLKNTQSVYRDLTMLLIRLELSVSTMESCTGGLISSLITDTPGASDIMKVSAVSYSNEAKQMFGVDSGTIEEYGVYSEKTVIEMAAFARKLLGADIGIGVSGSFGEMDKRNSDSIPGEVWFAFDIAGRIQTGKLRIEDAESRFECKLRVAYEIGNRLLIVLREDYSNR